MDIMLQRIIELIGKQHGAAKELTDALGVKSSMVTDWKAGKNKSYPKYAPQIAEHYGVSLDWLSGRDEQKTAPTESAGADEMINILQDFKDNPELRTLFSLSRKATPEQLKQYVNVIKALRGEDN